MIWVDYFIIGVVLISLISGFLRGFSLECFSLAFWLIAIGVGLSFCREFSVFLEVYITNTLLKITASFFLLFLITLMIGSFIRMLLGGSIKKPHIKFTARLGGMIFGILHGIVIVVALVMVAGLTSLPNDPWWQESTLLPTLQIYATWLRDHIPSGLTEFIHYR